jgi:hypothetical protein
MSFPRLLTIALVLAAALPLPAAAQDLRSPDAADPIPSLQMRDRAAPDPPIVQELRTLNTRDDAVAPAPAHPAPSASPDPFPWLEAGGLAALALVLIGLSLLITRRRRVGARA